MMEAGTIREAEFPKWVSNPVVIKNKNGKWRLCIDFADLNKVWLKDSFPLLKIDQLVNLATGHERMSFLKAYSGYH